MKLLRSRAWKLCVLLLLLIAALYALWKWYHPHHKPAVWPGYMIRIPASYTIHGIDVSRYQQEISWELVKGMSDQDIRLTFVFVRVAYGAAAIDPMFEQNWDASRKCGLVRGAYYFFNPDEDALTQADFFINEVSLEGGDLPPVLDIETKGSLENDSLRKAITIWLQRVEKHYAIKPLVYCNIDFYKKNLRGFIDEYPLWIAHYYADSPGVQRNWTFWQHNDRGRVNGIDSYVDFDTFNGDSAAFQQILYNGTAAEK